MSRTVFKVLPCVCGNGIPYVAKHPKGGYYCVCYDCGTSSARCGFKRKAIEYWNRLIDRNFAQVSGREINLIRMNDSMHFAFLGNNECFCGEKFNDITLMMSRPLEGGTIFGHRLCIKCEGKRLALNS